MNHIPRLQHLNLSCLINSCDHFGYSFSLCTGYRSNGRPCLYLILHNKIFSERLYLPHIEESSNNCHKPSSPLGCWTLVTECNVQPFPNYLKQSAVTKHGLSQWVAHRHMNCVMLANRKKKLLNFLVWIIGCNFPMNLFWWNIWAMAEPVWECPEHHRAHKQMQIFPIL